MEILRCKFDDLCRNANRNFLLLLSIYAFVQTATVPLSMNNCSLTGDATACLNDKIQMYENIIDFPIDILNEYTPTNGTGNSYFRQKRQVTRCPTKEQFLCKDGTCIDWDKPCDGVADCPDGSDEKFAICRNVSCSTAYFRCAYGGCIAKRLKCNKVKDCVDNSDELHVDCRKNQPPEPKCADVEQWRCPKSDQCIPRELVCDGKKDCANGNDETIAECSSIKSCNRFFKCAYGACIAKSGKCNYINECADNSDEDPDMCGPGYTPINTTPIPTSTPTNRIPAVTNTPQLGNGCIMPTSNRNSKYTLLGNIIVNPGEVVPSNSLLKLDCATGYSAPSATVIYCEDNKWTTEVPVCEKMCDPPESLTVQFTCSIPTAQGPSREDCDRKLPSGTTASAKCQSGHNSQKRLQMLTCRSGSWDNQTPRCEPACGRTVPKGEVYVIEGENAAKGEFPWHVAIYTQYGQEDQGLPPKYWCGGSILNRNLVVSAAHCFYNPITKTSFDPSLFFTAVGKMYSDYNHIEETQERHIQKSGVKEIKIPSAYAGELYSYASDIALLVLDKPLNFSNLVLPVCLDLSDENFDADQTSAGVSARVAGFGLVQAEIPVASETLKTTTMPIISRNQCREESPAEFEKYILNEKICAGYLNGTGVCKGDSGGGLVVSAIVKNVQTWYLRGIVSTAPSGENGEHCSIRTYSTFTKLFPHKDFIENTFY